MNKPFASPISRRPKYSAPMEDVVIMTMLAIVHRRHASQRQARRPSFQARGPAKREAITAPRVIREEMSCWRPGEMFQPRGMAGSL